MTEQKKPAQGRETGKRENKAPSFSFEGRYWWLPAVIMGSSIVVGLIALLIGARK